MPCAEYSVIVFRNVRTDTPSKRAVAVRFPLVLAAFPKLNRARCLGWASRPANESDDGAMKWKSEREESCVPLRYHFEIPHPFVRGTAIRLTSS
jgi:hypothetical protein